MVDNAGGTASSGSTTIFKKIKSIFVKIGGFLDKIFFTPAEMIRGESIQDNSILGSADKLVKQKTTKIVAGVVNSVDDFKENTVQSFSKVKKTINLLGVGLVLIGLYKIKRMIKK